MGLDVLAIAAHRDDLELLNVHYAVPHAASAYLAQQMLQHGPQRLTRSLKILTTLHGTDITLVGQDPSYFDITCFSLEVSEQRGW